VPDKVEVTPEGLTGLQRAFLAAYAVTGNKTEAAKLAECSRQQHYVWLQSEAYRETFQHAEMEACENLETEARRRAMHGVEEPVIYQGMLCHQPVRDAEGNIRYDDQGAPVAVPLTVRKYSDTLLIFLMKGAMPVKYRDHSKIEHDHTQNVTVTSKVDLSGLTDEQLKMLEDLARAASAAQPQ
jgi:hypothetical protein